MISPMTAEMAVQTAKQIYMLLYGVEVDEETFIQAVAPEILAPARMENLAAQEIVKRWCDYDCSEELNELSLRYDVHYRKPMQLPAQMESQQAGDSASV